MPGVISPGRGRKTYAVTSPARSRMDPVSVRHKTSADQLGRRASMTVVGVLWTAGIEPSRPAW